MNDEISESIKITSEPRSVSEKKKLVKKRLRLLKEAKKFTKNWTLIWLSLISIWILLGIVFYFVGWHLASASTVIGLCLFSYNLSSVKSHYKYHMEKIEELKQLEDQIVK